MVKVRDRAGEKLADDGPIGGGARGAALMAAGIAINFDRDGTNIVGDEGPGAL